MSSTAERSNESPSPRFFRLATQVAAEVSAASIVTPEPVEEGPDRSRKGLARSLPALPPLLPANNAEQFERPVVSRRRLPDDLRHPNAVRQGRRVRLPGPLAVMVVLFGIFATGVGLESVTSAQVLPNWLSSGSARPPAREVAALAASPPVGITIQSLNVRAVVNNVGLAQDGTIDVPPLDRAQEAGWYDQSPTPGQAGPSVIVGHVDTASGPAVFNQLSRLKQGDTVEVARQDRTVAVFQVEKLERFNKEHLPADQVYGDYSKPSLRVITCGGRWVGGQTGYADNVVVFANLIQAKRT
jgi:hypothetical protein